MQLPTGGITITRTTEGERYDWYGGNITWAAFEFLPRIPAIGESITIGPFTLHCIDRDDEACVVALQRVDE